MSKSTNLKGSTDETADDASDAIAAVLDRHRKFWLRSQTERPLLRVAPWVDWQPYPPTILRDGTTLEEGGEIRPNVLSTLANLAHLRPDSPLDGGMVRGWGPYDICWTEAMLGCRIVREGPSIWAQPFLSDWSEVDALPGDSAKIWLDELLSVNQLLVSEVKGRFPICQPLMRGPLDMAAAAVPTEMLYEGFYDRSDQLRKLLGVCTDLFIEAARRRLAETPGWRGGYVTRFEWGLWAPGTTAQFQADASRNISADLYRRFLWEFDLRLAREFEHTIIHTHSASTHILPVLVEEPNLKAIEVTLDPPPFGPAPLDLLPSFQMVQSAGKSLFICGPLKQAELDTLLELLSPVGLGIRAGLVAD